MKPEFSEILIPASKLHTSPSSDSCVRYLEREKTSIMNKCAITTAIIFAFIVAIVTTAFIVRYEDKLSHYEYRISSLEKELVTIYERYQRWEDEYGPSHVVSEKDFEYEIPNHSGIFGSEENAEYDQYLSNEEDQHQTVRLHEDKDLQGDVKVEVRSRRKRQIPFPTVPTFGPEVERTADGVPILESSYLDRTDTNPRLPVSRFEEVPTTESEGLRLYEGLVATGGRNEPKSLDFSGGSSSLLPHHRTSAAWSEKAESRSSGIQLKSGDSFSTLTSGFGESTGPQISDDLYYRRSTNRRSNTRGSTATGAGSSASHTSSGTRSTLVTSGVPAGTYHRSSRVPATSDFLYPSASQTNTRSIQYPPLKRLGQGDGEVIARVLQTDDSDTDGPHGASASANYGETASAHSESRRRQGARRVTPKRQTGLKHSRKISESDSGEISIVKAEAWVEGPKPVAAHYVADVSNYTTAHRHYEGNGRLRNADGIFAAWKPSEWMETSTATAAEEKNFVLNKNGVLTIKKPGLYYVYAQIHYLDEHDINGYVVQVNTNPFLQCTTMTSTQTAESKSNSCYTAGITHLKENDRVLVKDIETNRYSIFKPEKSFFGLMRIGDATH